MNNKKVMRSTGIGFVLLLLSLLITGLIGMSDLMNGGYGELYGRQFRYGLRASIENYFQLWGGWRFVHETAYIGLVLMFVAVFTTLVLLILAIKKKRPIFFIPALLLGASIAYLPFIFILVIPMIQLGVMRAIPILLMAGVTGLTLFAIYFEAFACRDLLKEGVAFFNKMAGEEKFEERPCACERKEEKKEEPVVAGLTEEEVRAIVEKYLAEHVEEKHPDGAVVVAQVEEKEEEPEEPEEEPEDEEEEEEEVVQVDDKSPVGLAIKGKRRRASFETRLKNSEFDIRHKYYDLRDYIKWYGLRNRISIPGDTFSYKRQRYVFVTIVGKHIRVYIGLNPDDYAESTIPVEKAEAKKYEDLPCLLRVKSDLSYRRAKKLVDDLMAKVGIPKPDEDEPKETQE